MEELLKSLSENVSEECYNEIMGIVRKKLMEDANTKYKAFNSQMTPERSKEVCDTINKQIAKDNAKIAKKPNKAAEKRIANNKEWLKAHSIFQQSGKKTPFEGGEIGKLPQ